MDSRLKSAAATILIQAGLAYALVIGLAMSFSPKASDRIRVVNLPVEAKPIPPPATKLPAAMVPVRPVERGSVSVRDRPVVLHDWSQATAEQRNLDFAKTYKWVEDNKLPEERRLARWRAELPRATGPARVTRLRPAGLATHTLYWPEQWSRGPLPIVAWANGYDGKCSNSSLPYAAFLAELASHGYFVVAVGNDDIEYPQPEGLEVLADGRPLRTQAGALKQAIDWAVAENARAGSPYVGRLDPRTIVYVGHGCGAGQAIAASADPRTRATIALSGRQAKDGGGEVRHGSLTRLPGWETDAAVVDLAAARRIGRAVVEALRRQLKSPSPATAAAGDAVMRTPG